MARMEFPVYLPSDLLLALGEHTGIFWSDIRMGDVVCDAVAAWMKPVPVAAQQPAAPSKAGYQWKQVFLPEGTVLRASFGRKPSFAVVEDSEIKYGERVMSPSGFANLEGSGNRNAWKAIWLRFPGSEEWLRADVCRAARQAAIARMFDADVPEAKPARQVAPHQPRDDVKPSTWLATASAERQDRAEDQGPRSKPPLHKDMPAMPREKPSRQEASASQSNEGQRKKGRGRSGRRKNRAEKRFPAKPGE
ncbi:hypothetical protein [Pseudoduganella namucuonensis]|uniref:Uncharacterized protein n=1 Tax=Pseudoduganella namucuonensis TaxID=1035707 RepID=A0A1I7M7E5_9BURK|nr:hypothetical protein [Pseudoduganella namucuonensis]SFV17710.1 hypothetical protein SAMN05216552_10725 [Pseudoduganella namucuonensis]